MKTIPDAFAEISLGALPEEEKDALIAVLTGEAVRAARLRQPGDVPPEETPVPWARGAYYLPADSKAGSSPLHAAGAYYLQEPSAMAAVAALDVLPGQRVLDLCAAPGGKSTQIAGLLGGHGVLVANEYVPRRARVLSQNIERMGVTNAIVTSELPDRLAARWGAWFDRVLVDAPCSGEGMFRREPDSCAEWTLDSPHGCAARQLQILHSAAELLLPGGVLVYSTCTFNTIENEDVIAAFCAAHPDFAPESFALSGVGVSEGGCLRLWPHRVRGEGHFVARLRRAGKTPVRPTEQCEAVRLSSVFPEFGEAELPGILMETGGTVWVYPCETPPLDGIRTLRNGLALGMRRGKILQPDHAVAMAFPPGTFSRALPVSEEDAARYLRGETLPAEGLTDGWAVIAYAGYCLGWGKCVGGTMKNHLPKGLRRMK